MYFDCHSPKLSRKSQHPHFAENGELAVVVQLAPLLCPRYPVTFMETPCTGVSVKVDVGVRVRVGVLLAVGVGVSVGVRGLGVIVGRG